MIDKPKIRNFKPVNVRNDLYDLIDIERNKLANKTSITVSLNDAIRLMYLAYMKKGDPSDETN